MAQNEIFVDKCHALRVKTSLHLYSSFSFSANQSITSTALPVPITFHPAWHRAMWVYSRCFCQRCRCPLISQWSPNGLCQETADCVWRLPRQSARIQILQRRVQLQSGDPNMDKARSRRCVVHCIVLAYATLIGHAGSIFHNLNFK